MASKVYMMENLGCAHCASQIEQKVRQLPQVEEAVMVFATKQLRVKTDQPDGLEQQIQAIAQSFEPDVTVRDRDRKSGGHHRHAHEHHHEHGEACGCGHDHEHEHHHEHGEACGCGHDHEHEHHHEHGEACGCGHDHEHEHHHEHGEACGCGHDHAHEHHHEHGEACGCGHDHEHEHHHEHGEACGCGHDHEHEHHHEHGEACGCGHDHEHEHHHEHGEACGCGHDHEHEHHHEHGEACGCGHDHEHEHHHEHGEACGCGHDHEHEHHHEHGEACGCGHDHEHEHHHEHGEACGCGHDHEHEHHHEHGEACGCGHDHEHEHHHEHGEACGCGHDHEHGHHHDAEEEPVQRSAAIGGETRVYTIENLDCANCGAKIERRINAMEGVSDAVLTFATKQLRVTAPNHDGLAEKMVQTARAVEPDVRIIPPETVKKQPKQQDDSNKKAILELVIGALCMAAGIALEQISMPAEIVVCVIGYLVLGRHVVWTALRNLVSGHVFDENFLMTVATLGAFAIGDYPEAVGVMLFFQIGELFEHVAVERSRSQIMDAVDMRPETVQWEHDGKIETIPAEEAEVDDILVVRPGDRIPLDGEVVEGESFLDTSAVTGEPVPIHVAAGDALVSGCVNTSGLLRMRVTKPLSESMVTRILDAVENAAANKPKIDRFITRFARVYTPIVVAIAVLTAVIPSLITGEWQHWIYTALTFLVISCPCALVLSVPLAYFAGIGSASRKGILFKGGASLELLADVRAAALDKTGTITKGTFTVTGLEPVNGLTEDQLLRLAAGCEQSSTHPIGVSIVAAAEQKQLEIPAAHEVQETAGHGICAVIEDNTVLCGGKKLMERYDIFLPELPDAGGATVVYVACNRQFAGRICISDTMKEDAVQAIAALKRQGVASAMLTGDGEESARAVAAQAGVDRVDAHLLPEEKLERLQDIRRQYGPVMFVGDGINDAPVLAGADVGAAMGTGADAAIEAADVVFLTGELSAVPQAIALAKQTAAIAKQNIVFALAIKLAVMILGLAGIASMWLAVFADTGVAMLCVLNSIRILYKK